MDKKSFIWGFLTGIVLTFVLIIIVGTLRQKTEEEDDTIQYLEQSVSYEGKKVTSFKVFQVLGDAALASEISNEEYKCYDGNTVMLLGENYYNDQVITIKKPQRVGTYSYTTKSGDDMTVPVIDGDIIE